MRTPSLLASLLALSLVACAAAPGEDATDPENLDEGTRSDAGTSKDGGKTTTARDGGSSTGTGSSSNMGGSSITIKSGDAAVATATNPLEGLGGIFGLGGSSDAGKAATATKSDGGAGQCENLICFDVFDCAIFHTDALDCGFTACTGFVCTK